MPSPPFAASDPQCSRANVEAFLEACRRFGIPEEHLLNAEDLADPTYTDRPGVVESLLFLRSHAEDHSASATHVDPGAPPLAAAVSPSRRSSHWDHAHEGPYRTHAPSDAPSVLRGSPVHGGRGADARATLAEVITGVRSVHGCLDLACAMRQTQMRVSCGV